MSADTIDGDARAEGASGGALDRDPFDPSYWQTAPRAPARADKPGTPQSRAPVPQDAIPDAAVTAVASDEPPPVDAKPAVPAPVAKVVPVSAPENPGTQSPVSAEAIALSKSLGSEIGHSVEGMMAAEASPALAVTATREGVVINLTDDARYSMFGVGSAVPDAKTVVLLEKVAKALASRPGEIVIRGYTDGRPFHSADYDNWRLSAARAHMAYYMLTRGGLDEARVEAIEGHADRSLKNPGEPNAAENRRIEILLKEKQ